MSPEIMIIWILTGLCVVEMAVIFYLMYLIFAIERRVARTLYEVCVRK